MKLTNKQIKQVIKEELNKVLNEEDPDAKPKNSKEYDTLVQLITSGPEGLNSALFNFDLVKGSGLLQPFEEDHIQRLFDYASASYRHKALKDEMRSIIKKLGGKI